MKINKLDKKINSCHFIIELIPTFVFSAHVNLFRHLLIDFVTFRSPHTQRTISMK